MRRRHSPEGAARRKARKDAEAALFLKEESSRRADFMEKCFTHMIATLQKKPLHQ
jgi:hypothetical protein